MADEKKKRRFGKKHVEAFEKNERGDYIYTGKTVVFAGDVAAWKRQTGRLWALAGAGFVCSLAVGMLPYRTDRAQFHILLPWALAVVLQILLLWKLGRVTAGKGELRSYVAEETIRQFPALSLAGAGLLLIRLGAMAADALGNAIRSSAGAAVAVGILLACGAVSLFLFYREQKKLLFKEV